ncbi:MAG: polyphenol oxidase family protein [Armatimonadetes bacterium]|nr:polyphenol oxidase family protein [Armatimonadota bacterium]
MQLLEFSSLRAVPNLRHAVTTRDSGVSSGAYASPNLAFHVGDEAEKVIENRRLLASELGFDVEKLVGAQQVHGNRIGFVTASQAGRGALDSTSALPETDALITIEKNLPLLTLVADCAPILLANPKKQVLAVVHAGWRGALAGIAGKVVRTLQNEFGSAPNDIVAGIGPCLSVENFEIGPEVAAQIEPLDKEAIVSGWDKPHLDLRGLLDRDLQRAGVRPRFIETMQICPKADNVRFFSHRGQNGLAGRFGLVAWWQ